MNGSRLLFGLCAFLFSTDCFSEQTPATRLETKLKRLAAMTKKCGRKYDSSLVVNERHENYLWSYRIVAAYEGNTGIEFIYEDNSSEGNHDGLIGAKDSFKLHKYKIRGRYLSDQLGGDQAHINKSGTGLWFCNLGQYPLDKVISEMEKYADLLIKDLSQSKYCK